MSELRRRRSCFAGGGSDRGRVPATAARPGALRPDAISGERLQACPWCMTTDLYIQKDFPQGLGLFIVGVGFAISTVFWYYEMPIPAYLVLVVSIIARSADVSPGRRRHDLLSMSVPVAGGRDQSRRPVSAVRPGGRRTVPARANPRPAVAGARGTGGVEKRAVTPRWHGRPGP